MIEIPVSFKENSADFNLSIDIDEVIVFIRLTYNVRVDKWLANINADGNTIKALPLVTNYLLLRKHKAKMSTIKGDFIVARITDNYKNPPLTYENIGTDWGLFYLNQDEVKKFNNKFGLI